MDHLDEIISKIKSLKQPNKTLLVAIDGRGGSGKSILAENKLAKYQKRDFETKQLTT